MNLHHDKQQLVNGSAFSREQNLHQASLVPAIDGEVVSGAPEKRDDFSKFVRGPLCEMLPEGICVVHSSPSLACPCPIPSVCPFLLSL